MPMTLYPQLPPLTLDGMVLKESDNCSGGVTFDYQLNFEKKPWLCLQSSFSKDWYLEELLARSLLEKCFHGLSCVDKTMNIYTQNLILSKDFSYLWKNNYLKIIFK